MLVLGKHDSCVWYVVPKDRPNLDFELNKSVGDGEERMNARMNTYYPESPGFHGREVFVGLAVMIFPCLGWHGLVVLGMKTEKLAQEFVDIHPRCIIFPDEPRLPRSRRAEYDLAEWMRWRVCLFDPVIDLLKLGIKKIDYV